MAAIPSDVFFATIPELNARLKAKEFKAEELARAFAERLAQLFVVRRIAHACQQPFEPRAIEPLGRGLPKVQGIRQIGMLVDEPEAAATNIASTWVSDC